jgi:hypothetical protein
MTASILVSLLDPEFIRRRSPNFPRLFAGDPFWPPACSPKSSKEVF